MAEPEGPVATIEEPVGGTLPAEAGEPDLAGLLQENERLKQEIAAAGNRRAWTARARMIVVAVLVVLASIAVVLSLVAWWTHETVLDTDRFMEVVGPLADDPAVQSAVAVNATDQIFSSLEVESRVREVLPDRAAVLAGPLTSAVEDFTEARLRDFTATPEFAALWETGLRRAHEGAVAVIREEAPNVSVVDGEVQLNLLPIVAEGINRLAEGAAGLINRDVDVDVTQAFEDPSRFQQLLAQRLDVTLPEDFGQVTLMSETQLRSIQDAVRLFDRLVYVLIAVTVLLIVLALAFSLRRRRTLVHLGIGVAVAVVVTRLITHRVQQNIVESIADPTGRGAARSGIPIVFENLRSIGTWLLVAGLVLAVLAYLLGRPPWLVRLVAWARESVRPKVGGSDLERFVDAHYDPLRVGGSAVALVVLLWVGIGWLSVLVLGALVAAWLWGLAYVEGRALAAPQLVEGQEPPAEESPLLPAGEEGVPLAPAGPLPPLPPD